MRAVCAAIVASPLLFAPAAAAPSVVASVAPVHSLVTAVMEGIGEPTLLVKGAASPHTYSMRPSDATALSEADVVFWVDEDLEAFLQHPLKTLGSEAESVSLIDAPGVVIHTYRDSGEVGDGGAEAHDHGHDHDHDHAEGPHADHDDAHDDGHAHRDDGRGHTHAAGEPDAHVWLDPQNGVAMLDAISGALSSVDPENAGRYRENAEAAKARLRELDREIAETLEPVKDRPFVVFHDAFQYFQRHYGLNIAGIVTVSPERAPGAARLREIQARITETSAVCVFAEPQFEPSVVQVVMEGTPARSGVLDPVGADLEPGADLYAGLLRNVAQQLVDCLSEEG
ncbi:zinc ABC transporter substrate-binding protein ZnuA [Lutibaculum baratangense]|uniref:High-affinity zinc uptake system protein ZnuA n=1 Tax=Lutibaculum baratangense AMV1 TaxID=631454 RepID=V4RB06_9HYPH|nr:zinc ABC transporter substrate-binding protein ZnuA [Lutibaculum baratangense]ESR22584.1 Zinc ABC transporter, periplasmic-binding protein ZnuA [Lutibaculum baratangense AMV1]